MAGYLDELGRWVEAEVDKSVTDTARYISYFGASLDEVSAGYATAAAEQYSIMMEKNEDYYRELMWDIGAGEEAMAEVPGTYIENEEYKVKEGLLQLEDGVDRGIGGWLASIGDVLVNIAIDLSSVTSGIIAGITEGLSSLAEDFGDALAGMIDIFVDMIWDKLTEALKT